MSIATVLFSAYLMGSIPSAVWLGTLIYGVDVRQHGSRNSGATNTFRVLGKGLGFTVLFMDILKGFLTIQLAAIVLHDHPKFMLISILTGCLCVIGHVNSIFLKFKGGKGVATSLGVFLALNPYPALVCFAIFVLILLLTHYVSLASLITASLLPGICYAFFHQVEWTYVLFNGFIACLVLFTHRKNIQRLYQGCEPKMNFSKPKA